VKRSAIFGVMALVPAALNLAPASAHALAMPICSGDGLIRTVTVPIPGNQLPGRDVPGCCAKGCHTGSRKKARFAAN
jgi:hypothetical protein